MSKALRVQIINYLKENDAVSKYIDVKTHVLSHYDSVQHRDEFKATLDYLSASRYIIVNGTYEFLHWRLGKDLYSLDNKLITAKLTPHGILYQPEEDPEGMEAEEKPILTVMHKSGSGMGAGYTYADEYLPPANYQVDTTVPFMPDAEPEYPWYTESAPEATIERDKLVAKPEYPWYTEPTSEVPKAEPAEAKTEELLPEPEYPWYTEPATEAPKAAEPVEDKVEELLPEPEYPWYTEPATEAPKAAEPVEDKAEELLPEPEYPWYTESTPEAPKAGPVEAKTEELLPEPEYPWYTEPLAEKPEEQAIPTIPAVEPSYQRNINNDFKQPEPIPFNATTGSAKQGQEPVIYKFPPLDLKFDTLKKPPPPMVIERLNQNLSNGIDAISNIKIDSFEAITGDFETDVNVVLRFVFIVVVFLFLACIIWVFLG